MKTLSVAVLCCPIRARGCSLLCAKELTLTVIVGGSVFLAEAAPQTFCNPMSLPDTPIGVYCRDATLGMDLPSTSDWKHVTWMQSPHRRPFREVADPTVYVENGVWYLYPSGGLLWKSTDCGGTWKHVERMKESRYAPAFCKFRGKYYLVTFDGPLCVADSPEGPFRELGFFERNTFGDDPQMAKFYDPELFADGDRVYLYWGCCNPGNKSIWGAELDPDDLRRAKSKAVCLVEKDSKHHPWQRILEGPSVFRRKGVYYLTYSVGGTDSPKYAWIATKGATPLGPFVHQRHNPFFYTPTGLITGTAHGCVFDSGNDDWWVAYTILVGGYHYFERLCGLDRIGFDENGDLTASSATSTPQWLPSTGLRGDAGWQALTLHGDAKHAIDDVLKTWWEIRGTLPQKLKFTLDNISEIRAVRLVWKDVGLDPLRGVIAGPYRYRLWARTRGKWEVWIDASENDRDLLSDYREGRPMEADAVSLEILSAPKGIVPALDEISVFGVAPFEFQ